MKKIVFVIGSLLLASSSFANSEQNTSVPAGENGCRFFEVEIANSTNSSCVITNEYLAGNPVGTMPASYTVLPGTKVTFLGRESVFGINMDISANCGSDHSIEFTVFQGHCGGLWAEPIRSRVWYQKNMRVFRSADWGSSTESRPGKFMAILTNMD